ncbi:hypothetical protein SEA_PAULODIABOLI_273 [Microbacterium phage PauloDiaboli]|nr:hypothetical protein SEA_PAULODIABOLI_273 [Microbacterium phage PauloDiaboli]QWY84080.1 hypothetical protein SEA_A3WALLY_273 [Microbacterium phage A3Wally]
MIIEFKDPGVDFTPVFVTLGILGAILLFAGLCAILYVARGYRSNADRVAGISLIVAAFFAVSVVPLGGFMPSMQMYGEKVDQALYQELRDAGFTGIQIDHGGKGEDDILTGYLDDEEFKGIIVDLDYPKDHAYKITELEVSK